MAIITMYMDGRLPVTVDEDEFELIKVMVAEAGGDLKAGLHVANELVAQGYEPFYARQLVVLARSRG